MKRPLALLMILSIVSVTTAFPASPFQDPAPSQPVADQSPLTNQDVLEMVKSGLSAEIVVAKIKASPTKFDTAPAALSELKESGVPESVIMAMVQVPAVERSDSITEVDTKVPDGTEIEIELRNTLSGQEAKIGDTVDFTIVRAVQVNGVTIFERDSPARAKITTAKKAGRWGKAGKLEWAMQDVQAVDGNRVPARFTKRELGDSKGGTVAVAAVATTVLLGPLGLLWGLKKGKPAIIPAGNRYSVFVHGDIVIKGKSASVATRP